MRTRCTEEMWHLVIKGGDGVGNKVQPIIDLEFCAPIKPGTSTEGNFTQSFLYAFYQIMATFLLLLAASFFVSAKS